MKKIAVLLFILIVAGTASLAQMGSGMRDALTPLEYSRQRSSEEMRISRGGQLYDDWWRTTVDSVKPDNDHPLWKKQDKNKRGGYDTYRCKECHGWDYRGRDGAYGKGSHYTGFTGIYEASRKMSEKDLEAVLKGSADKEHDFTGLLSNEDIADLALFMKKGIIDMTGLINADGVPAGGNTETGRAIFVKSCMHMCHGGNGTAINFGDSEKPEFIGTVAGENPWEFVHKVRSGQPGTRMRSAIINKWSDANIRDLLSYARTLPSALPEPGFFSRLRRGMGFGMGHHDWFIPEDSRGFGPIMD